MDRRTWLIVLAIIPSPLAIQLGLQLRRHLRERWVLTRGGGFMAAVFGERCVYRNEEPESYWLWIGAEAFATTVIVAVMAMSVIDLLLDR